MPGGFSAHIRHEHDLWNYLYYAVLLHEKSPTEYSGPESSVAALLEKEDLSFVPSNRALSIHLQEASSVASGTTTSQVSAADLDRIQHRLETTLHSNVESSHADLLHRIESLEHQLLTALAQIRETLHATPQQQQQQQQQPQTSTTLAS